MKKFLLLGILMLIYGYGFSQTISKPDRDLPFICKDSEIEISFDITGSFVDGSKFEVYISDDVTDYSGQILLGSINYSSGQTHYSDVFSVSGVADDKYYIKIRSTDPVEESPNSPDDINTFSIILNDPVGISPDGPTEFCDGGSVMLVNSNFPTDQRVLEWFRKGSPDVSVGYHKQYLAEESGTYYAVSSIGNCSVSSNEIVVVETNSPTSIINEGDQDICFPNTFTFTADETDPSLDNPYYEWLDENAVVKGTGPSFTTGISGVYRLRTTNYGNISVGGGCPTISDPVTLVVHDFVAEILETGPMKICSGEEVTLNSSETNSEYIYNWKLNDAILPAPISGVGKSTYTFTSSEDKSGDYTLEIITPACTKESSAVTITIKDSPAPFIIVKEGNLKGCDGATVTLASGVIDDANVFTYQWFKDGFPLPVISKTLPIIIGDNTYGNYYYEMSFGSCKVRSASVLVMLVPKPVSSILEGSEVIACEGEEAILTADSDLNGSDPANVVYEWIDATDAVVGTGLEFKTSISGDYRLVTKNENVCNDISSVTKVIISKKANSTIDYTSLADCEQITLTANSDLQLEDPSRVVYRWLDENDVLIHESTDFNDVNLVVTSSGLYKLQTLNYGLCSGVIDQVTVNINDLDPSIVDDVNSPFKVCTDNAHRLEAFENDVTFTYSWYLNGDTNPVKTGHENFYDVPSGVVGDFSYVLHVFDPSSNCGKDSDPVIVEVKDAPVANITNGDFDACETDDSVILLSEETNTSYTYKWYKDDVLVTDTDGIDFQLTLDVSQNTNTDTKYKLEVSYGESCSITSTEITLHKVITPQAVVVAAGETTVCDDSTVLLRSASIDKEAPTTYRWFKVVDGADVLIPGANQWEYDAQATGEYKIEVTNKGICSNLSDPISVIVTPSVEAVISPNVDQYVCDNVPFSSVNSVNVIVGVTTFQWYRIVNGVETAIPFATEETYNAKEEGDYFFEAFNHGVCGSRSEVVNVKFTQFEHEIEEAPLVKECEGHQIVLHSINTDTDNYQFTWFKEGSTDIIGKGLTYTVNGDLSESGNYVLEVSEKGATCVKTSEPVTVVILPDPVSKINLGGGFNCEGAFVTLNSEETNDYYDYTWYFNDNEILAGDANYENVNSPSLKVTMVDDTEGVYTVKVSIGSCNTGLSNAVMLDMYDLQPQLDVDPGMVLCRDGSIALTAITNDNDDVAKYRWFRDGNPITGENLETTIVDHIGIYKAEVTSKLSGCVQFTEDVDISLVPYMGVVEDTIYANSGETVTFEALGGDSYVWFDSRENIVQTGGDKFQVEDVEGNMAYQVKISNGYCDEVFNLLIVSGEITADNIQNLMTPNGDGHNDTWKLPPGFVSNGDEVILLNRQGNVVFKSTDYKDNWRGTFNDGPELPSATYFYVIKRKNKEPIMGSVTIFR